MWRKLPRAYQSSNQNKSVVCFLFKIEKVAQDILTSKQHVYFIAVDKSHRLVATNSVNQEMTQITNHAGESNGKFTLHVNELRHVTN